MLDRLLARYDVAVVGGGPAGLAAALGAREAGAERVLVLDREEEAGGILLQCIHSGFGLHHLKQELTGPEYAAHFVEKAIDRDVDLVTRSYVSGIGLDSDGRLRVRVMREGRGIYTVDAGAVVLAMGCRERTRGALRIPGTRPAGVLTAGLAQRFVNVMGLLPGRRVAILGSGDIGLIMARRLTLEGPLVAKWNDQRLGSRVRDKAKDDIEEIIGKELRERFALFEQGIQHLRKRGPRENRGVAKLADASQKVGQYRDKVGTLKVTAESSMSTTELIDGANEVLGCIGSIGSY